MAAHLVVWYLVFLFSVTFHEYAHARLATALGDYTAGYEGFATLDPIPHLKRSPFGLIFIPILTFVQAGWMMGWASVPYDPSWGQKRPLGKALMSAAGPVANFLLCGLAWAALRLLLHYHVIRVAPSPSFEQLFIPNGYGAKSPVGALCFALPILADLNLILGLFNLMPVPPLDGASILEGLAPRRLGPIFDKLRESFILGWAALIIWWQLFDRVAAPLRTALAVSLIR